MTSKSARTIRKIQLTNEIHRPLATQSKSPSGFDDAQSPSFMPDTDNNGPSNQGLAKTQSTLPPNTFRRVCYFCMDSKSTLKLSQVDGTLCTHLILASARVSAQGELCVVNESNLVHLNEVAPLKIKYPHLRVLISVRNNEQNSGFQRLTTATSEYSGPSGSSAAPAELRLRFAKSAMQFLKRFQLDGLDLDWEFPNFPTSLLNPRDHERAGLTKILTTLRSAIVENFYARQTEEQLRQQVRHNGVSVAANFSVPSQFTIEPHLLTATVAGQEAVLRNSYELKQMVNLCDWLNVMSYDYFLFKAYAPFTGPNAPLFPIVDPYVPVLHKLALSWTVHKLLREDSLPSEKIVMGIPTYARAYRLIFRQTQPVPFTLALGSKGGQVQEDYLNYGEVLSILKREDTVVDFDERAQVPYLLTDSGYTWISYENARSVRSKVLFIMQENLGGYMTWNINSDFFLHSAANDHQQKVPNQNDKKNFPLHAEMLEEVKSFFSNLDDNLKVQNSI